MHHLCQVVWTDMNETCHCPQKHRDEIDTLITTKQGDPARAEGRGLLGGGSREVGSELRASLEEELQVTL